MTAAISGSRSSTCRRALRARSVAVLRICLTRSAYMVPEEERSPSVRRASTGLPSLSASSWPRRLNIRHRVRRLLERFGTDVGLGCGLEQHLFLVPDPGGAHAHACGSRHVPGMRRHEACPLAAHPGRLEPAAVDPWV